MRLHKNPKIRNSRHPAPKYRGISGSDYKNDEIPKQVRDDSILGFLDSPIFDIQIKFLFQPISVFL
ncbi:MAG: hypothetical protein A2W90_03060 [Bacteroidetes bacterium GWF2_42_66]|nr:MAG: hypothetical protein A2W92_10455 [Bacteroidetes bacterium GWA2_42_15]OFY01320.1 MAG: hypothetical protein A2W89_16545 [Bacteroidetes bacterium GWE2_42_39]OFY42164.1 MAG: hypothetical protein A2W90_03060 [Bacteroidetes bacterium GWF2_42_66]HBL77627.1 hypothetical protein [Prolixibacteraceae bacterium]HCR89920.1 hypothetical protein [Prolixibacteraceae bacterium]